MFIKNSINPGKSAILLHDDCVISTDFYIAPEKLDLTLSMQLVYPYTVNFGIDTFRDLLKHFFIFVKRQISLKG